MVRRSLGRFLFAPAQLLESRAMERAGSDSGALGPRASDRTRHRGGVERALSVDDVRLGDIVIVRPGEKIPLDGRVSTGTSHVNQAPVTGESARSKRRRATMCWRNNQRPERAQSK